MGFKGSGQMTGTGIRYSTMSYTWIYRKQAWSGFMKIQDPSSVKGEAETFSAALTLWDFNQDKEPSDLLKDIKRSSHTRYRAKRSVNKPKLPLSWDCIKEPRLKI